MKWYLIYWNIRELQQANKKRHLIYHLDSDAKVRRTKQDGVYYVENNRYEATIVREDKLDVILKENNLTVKDFILI